MSGSRLFHPQPEDTTWRDDKWDRLNESEKKRNVRKLKAEVRNI